MKVDIPGWRKVCLLVLLFLCSCGALQAAYLTDWSGPGVYTLPAPQPGGAADPRNDILNIWYRADSGNHYFRMDLAGVPGVGSGPDYTIQIDMTPGGASFGDGTLDAAKSYMVAGSLTGIDYIIDANALPAGGWGTEDLHTYTPGLLPFNFSGQDISAGFQSTENGGTTLEWSMPIAGSFADAPFTMWGATKDFVFGATFDNVGPVHTPEPGTLLIAASIGLIGMGFEIRRRRAARSA